MNESHETTASGDTIPRRSRLDLMKCSEVLIYNAMVEIEQMGADRRLTAASIKLQEARDLVSDFIDNINPITDTTDNFISELVENCKLVKEGSEENGHDCWGKLETTRWPSGMDTVSL